MESYEKKYKELVCKIEKAYLYAQTDSTKAVLEEIHPELKESEDERIRRDIISYIQVANQIIPQFQMDNWITWLEKQVKQKIWSVEDTFNVQRICKYLDEAKKYYADITEVRECMDWLKSLKERIGG